MIPLRCIESREKKEGKMSQKKRNKEKAKKEDNCKEEKEPPYDVIIAIDEDERKVEGVARGKHA